MSTRLLAGRYELIERIGEGGMAVVYKAKDRLLNRFVAVKILKPEFTKDVKVIESFRRESQSAASLSHPNIVNVYDVGKEGNIHYIIMELIEGNVLSDVIKQEGPMDPKKVVSIAKQIANALSVAHKNQIIHRDVKPHNILITQDGVAKITDFGIAKAVSSATIVGNQTGTIMGSVHYFSPEQARGGYVDEKSDIYSLGIVMYEMLVGQVPFDAENPVAVAVMHMNEEMVEPSKLVPTIPPDVEAIVMKATAKYQINRYKSADEMITALSLVNYHPATTSGQEATGVTATAKGGAGEVRKDKNEDRENDGKGKKKKKFNINKTKMGAVLLAVILAIPASALVFHFAGKIGQPKEVTVPQVVGMTQEEAEKALADLGLELKIDLEVASEDYDEGEIVSQDPKEESKAKEGQSVTVNISKGKAEAGTVPKVTGQSLENAKYTLGTYGYKVGEISKEASDLPVDVVISQSPKSGESLDDGDRVDLVISLGTDNEEISMMNLIGEDITQAADDLSKVGLKLGEKKYEKSTKYAANVVIAQSVEFGSKIKRGTTVNLTVSKGSEGGTTTPGTDTEGPKSVAFEVSYAPAKNEVFSLSVVVSDTSGVRTPISKESRYKSDGSEMISLSGTGKGTIKVIFDNDVVQSMDVDFATGEVF